MRSCSLSRSDTTSANSFTSQRRAEAHESWRPCDADTQEKRIWSLYTTCVNPFQEVQSCVSVTGVSLSSDFIAGFCGETEEDHQQTVSLLREVCYNVGFLFAYSMRQKTRAFHRLQDDVPAEVKQRRLQELITVFREEAARANETMVGQCQLVLVEGPSKRSALELCGRNDGNIKVIFPDAEVEDAVGCQAPARAQPGDYVLVKVT